jgi:16S rRNA U1498 N3-methylase RsmE
MLAAEEEEFTLAVVVPMVVVVQAVVDITHQIKMVLPTQVQVVLVQVIPAGHKMVATVVQELLS